MSKSTKSLADLKNVKAALKQERLIAEQKKKAQALAEKAQIIEMNQNAIRTTASFGTDQENSNFSTLLSGITPLKDNNSVNEAIHREQATKAALKAQSQLKSISAIVVDAENKKSAIFNEEYSGFIRNSYNQKKAHKHLAHYGPKAKITLDVHGLRQQEAIDYINYALDEALKDNFDCIKIIHGKGLHSQNNESILQPTTIDTLALHPHVICAMVANHQDGGSGATYVLLSPLMTK